MKTTPFRLQSAPMSLSKCIQAHTLSVEQAREIRGIVACADTRLEEYAVRKACGAFLQGYKEDGEQSWVFVEFWSDSLEACEAFVAFVNKRLGLEG